MLINKPKWYSIGIEIIKALLTNRCQYVECNNNGKVQKPSVRKTDLGIDQGSATSRPYLCRM